MTKPPGKQQKMAARPSLSLAIAAVDAMIDETVERTRPVPFGLEAWGTELGINLRLALLKEVRANIVKTGLLFYEGKLNDV